MSLVNIINRIREHLPEFTYQASGSVLSALISQLDYEIESIQTSQASTLDLFNQTGNSLDELGQLLGLSRHVIVALDQNAVVPDQVTILCRNPQHSILTVMQNLFGESTNFPVAIKLTDGTNTFETDWDFRDVGKLNVHQLIVPVKFVSYGFQTTMPNTELKVIGQYEELNDYLVFKTNVALSLYQYVEPDDQFRSRIQTRLQNLVGPTKDYLVSNIMGLFPNVRYVLVKNFARGLQTQNIIIFPTIQQIYDENYQLITENTLAEEIEKYFTEKLQLGTDVQFLNAEQVILNVEVYCSNVSEQNRADFENTVKTTVINLIYSYPVGQEFTLSVSDFKIELDQNLAIVDYPYRLDQVKIKVNNQEVQELTINETQYMAVQSVTVNF